MFGVTYKATDTQPERRYYQCHGKDPIMSAREHKCTQRPAKANELEETVWEHVKGLMRDPERLLSRFEQFAHSSSADDDKEDAEAKKFEAHLRRLSREQTRLVGAYLSGADLSDADLRDAHLENADVRKAKLNDANLSGADVSGADLSGANLWTAKGWTDDQLRAARAHEGSVIPDRQILKADTVPEGPTFEEWLKSKGRREDGQNSGN